MPDQAALLAALRAVLPEGTALASADPLDPPGDLWPGERLVDALPARRAEFAAGRRAARAAMAALGMAPAAIPHLPDRAPGWPAGVTGAITHAGRTCLAVVGPAADWLGLGLDVEADHPLDPALWPDILRAEELALLHAMPEAAQGHAAMAVFVAKEAAYKAQYPRSRTLFDFHALRVRQTGAEFAARFMIDVPGFAAGTTLAGNLCHAGGHVAAFCAIRRPAGV